MSPKSRRFGSFDSYDVEATLAKSYGKTDEREREGVPEVPEGDAPSPSSGIIPVDGGAPATAGVPTASVPVSSDSPADTSSPSSSRRRGRPRREAAAESSKCRLLVDEELLILLGYERARCRKNKIPYGTNSKYIMEAVGYYLKHKARDVYDRYKEEGLIC